MPNKIILLVDGVKDPRDLCTWIVHTVPGVGQYPRVMDLAISVAIGSSMQIALLVIPFSVILGWFLGYDNMNLSFDGFEIAVLFVLVLLVNYLKESFSDSAGEPQGGPRTPMKHIGRRS